jgi:hypothetical protein
VRVHVRTVDQPFESYGEPPRIYPVISSFPDWLARPVLPIALHFVGGWNIPFILLPIPIGAPGSHARDIATIEPHVHDLRSGGARGAPLHGQAQLALNLGAVAPSVAVVKFGSTGAQALPSTETHGKHLPSGGATSTPLKTLEQKARDPQSGGPRGEPLPQGGARSKPIGPNRK